MLLQLGTPKREFEEGRILCCLLRKDEGTGRLVAVPRMVGPLDPGHGSWKWADYDLVLVFANDGRIARHSLWRLR